MAPWNRPNKHTKIQLRITPVTYTILKMKQFKEKAAANRDRPQTADMSLFLRNSE